MQEQQDHSIALGDVEALVQVLVNALMEGDMAQAEERAWDIGRAWIGEAFSQAIDIVLSDNEFRDDIRELGRQRGLKLHSYQHKTIVLPGGGRKVVESPYFRPAEARRSRQGASRKSGPNGSGCHLALELFGLQHDMTPGLAAQALTLAILCPSYAIASEVLESYGITISGKTLHSMVADFSGLSGSERVALSSKDGESLAEKRVLLTVDGGRYRERRDKLGCQARGKPRPYHTDWKEPKLFAIAVLNADGEVDPDFRVQVDGSVGGKDAFIELLREYLDHMQIADAREVTIAGDGAKWIWEDIPALLAELGVEATVHQVLDYTHAKQNLLELRGYFFGCKNFPKRDEALKSLLHEGDMAKLKAAVLEETKFEHRATVAAKMDSYFLGNAERMRYKFFEAAKIPRGSGLIESAIRRVINLRVKSPGSFWKPANAEAMIFLRSKLLYGRWQTLWQNRTAKIQAQFTTIKKTTQRPQAA